MAKRATEGEIPDKYLTTFEREMQETTDGKVTKTWKEYARGYVPYGASDEDSAFDKLATKTAWGKDKDSIMGQKLSGAYTHFTRGAGAIKAMESRFHGLQARCKAGNKEACASLRASAPLKNKGFAQGGMLDTSSRLWKMESTYPEFQKGIANRVTKDRVPTAPIEEEYMYSPTQSGYPQGYADGGSVYDTEGSMLAPEVPLNFEEDMPAEMPMEAEESEMGLSPEETEVLGQAMSDYPELEDILNKIGSAMDAEFTGEGAVEGPGTETSDSINAKLSDGEFVFTAKAVKQLGVDKLRKMMNKAEGEYDEASTKQEYQQMDDMGYAKGGFFDRPRYNEGDLVTQDEKLQSRLRTPEKGLLGSIVQSIADTVNIPRRSITPDDYEREAAEHRARMREEAIQAKEQEYADSLPAAEDEMSPENRALLERGNEAIYPEQYN